MSDLIKPIDLAIRFHETYERLAPLFGYVTRQDTAVFDADSPNGKLMIAVCAEVLRDCRAEIANLKEVNANLSNLTLDYEIALERRKYVPIPDKELQEIVAGWLGVSDDVHFGIAKSTQAAVIKRAGLDVA